MNRVRIVGSKTILPDLVRELHSIGTLHVEELTGNDESGVTVGPLQLDKEKIAAREKLGSLLVKLREISLLLPSSPPIRARIAPPSVPPLSELLSADFINGMVFLYEEINVLHRRRHMLREEYKSVNRYQRILSAFAPLIVALEGVKRFEVMGLVLDIEKEGLFPLIEEEVGRITDGRAELFRTGIDEGAIGILIVYTKDYDRELKRYFSGENISKISVPSEYADEPFVAALKKMIVRKAAIPEELGRIDTELNNLSSVWCKKIESLRKGTEDYIDELDIVEECSQTKFAFLLAGWVPVPDCNNLSASLLQRFGDKISVDIEKVAISGSEDTPVKVVNNRYVRPFSIFMTVFSPPVYGSMEPTPFMAFFFPVFFGLILGDVGYGAVIFALTACGRYLAGFKTFFRDLFTVFMTSSLFAILFGFLFGEFFGDLGESFGLHPLLMDRRELVEPFLLLAVAVGALHVLLGISLMLVTCIRQRKIRPAIANAASLSALISFILVLLSSAGYMKGALLLPSAVALFLSIMCLIMSHGFMGPLEIIKSLGNMLSYARIMAIGMASVILAVVANELGRMMHSVILGVLVALPIHMINIMLGIFSPAIHSLRLHYVEFFSKFYIMGGKQYRPFRRHL